MFLKVYEKPLTANPFADEKEAARLKLIVSHKAWFKKIKKEYPSPYQFFKVGVYIRYFNQTKYDNYLDYHKMQFVDLILKDESSMALFFQATMAQEESHSKSRCMEQSLRMRLDHGIPLTPDRIGFRKNKISGKLYVFEDEYETVKLAYFMVLLGYWQSDLVLRKTGTRFCGVA